MKKFLFLLLFDLVFLGVITTKPALADYPSCTPDYITTNMGGFVSNEQTQNISIDFNGSKLSDGTYKVTIARHCTLGNDNLFHKCIAVSNHQVTPSPLIFYKSDHDGLFTEDGICTSRAIIVDKVSQCNDTSGEKAICAIENFYKTGTVSTIPPSCHIEATSNNSNNSCVDVDTTALLISARDIQVHGSSFNGNAYLDIGYSWASNQTIPVAIANGTLASQTLSLTNPPNGGKISIALRTDSYGGSTYVGTICNDQNKVTVVSFCTQDDSTIDNSPETDSNSNNTIINAETCPGGTDEQPILKTALGCIPTDPAALVGWILTYAISIGGGIAFLMMVWGSFLLITSSGNPEQVKQGQETLVSAGAGLLFIIFSLYILKLIGVNVLQIPGFS